MHADQEQRIHQMLTEATRNVRAYQGSELSEHAIALLDALTASYCLDLVHVAPEGLVRIQSALKQVSFLRNVFANDGMDIPKI